MSYDYEIRGNENYSFVVEYLEIVEILKSIKSLQLNHRQAVFSVENIHWMSIDLENVSEEGDSIDEAKEGDPKFINLLMASVPYGFIEHGMRPYEDLLNLIAGKIGWEVIDLQTGDEI